MQNRTGPSPLPKPLTGIVPPLITPLRDRDALDEPGLERLIEHILGGRVSGLFILGTTGEGPSLGYRLRRELVERTCHHVRGRVPVLVGITDTAVVEALGLASYAAEAGAAALVAAPPYYLPGGQPELREFLGHLVRELPLPLFLYNMPALTKVPFDLETVRFAMDEPRIVGLKDSSGDMAYFRGVVDLLPHRPDWTLLIGPEERLLDAVLSGGHGGVSGGANVFPALYVALYEACRAGDAARAFRLHAQVLHVSSSLYRIGRHPSAVIKGIKSALSCQGICDDFMAEPFHRFRAGERAVVEQRLAELQAELRTLGC
jgi:dihydrodipicolinate synthase/N-acetylneuraminate lyase